MMRKRSSAIRPSRTCTGADRASLFWMTLITPPERTAVCNAALDAWKGMGNAKPPGTMSVEDYGARAPLLGLRSMELSVSDAESFKAAKASAETAWKDKSGADKVGVEFVYNSETFDRYANNAFFSQGNGNHIRIDPNVTLPDGRPNPNVGRPYVMGASAAQLNRFESERTNATQVMVRLLV